MSVSNESSPNRSLDREDAQTRERIEMYRKSIEDVRSVFHPSDQRQRLWCEVFIIEQAKHNANPGFFADQAVIQFDKRFHP